MTLGIAIAGLGRMGRRRVASVLRHPDTDLIDVFDTDASRSATEDGLTSSRLAKSFSALVNDPRVDAIMICTPNVDHHWMVAAALQAGRHVFCEKPLAVTNADCAHLLALAGAGASLRVGANFRFLPSAHRALVEFRAGRVGRPLFARGWIGHAGWNLHNTWYVDRSAAGGGTYLDNGVHLLEYVSALFGPSLGCLGQASTQLWDVAPSEDNAVGLFTFVDGATAIIQSSWTEWNGYAYLEVYGTDGFIRIDERGKNSEVTFGGRAGEVEVVPSVEQPRVSFDLEFDDWIGSLKSGRVLPPVDAARAVQMALGVYESNATRRYIAFPTID